MSANKRIVCLVFALLLLLGASPAAYADGLRISQPLLENLSLSVDGGESVNVRTIHYSYPNNRYVSLRDFAVALNGTPKRFSLNITGDNVIITTGQAYKPVGGENKPFSDTNGAYVYSSTALVFNPIQIDGRALRYLTFLGANAASKTDCFMSLTDLAMQLDLDLAVSAEGVALDTAGSYTIDLETLRDEGFFYEVHSALVGDIDTGVIYASWEPELAVPIASTTKLMTYILLRDAISDGLISTDDSVTLPAEAARLSRTPDGTIPMQAGAQASFMDLLHGMLLASSNECALALAVHTAGSEEAFVEQMNRKARVLGLSEDAVFFNCHGLPIYTDNLPATKIQNRMSALDMFALVTHLLNTYPDVTEITSQKNTVLTSLSVAVDNTNPLLYNLDGVVGLKTGTTNMSGACLVTALEAEDAEGNAHRLVAVEFGAEDSTIRATLSEELLRYALQRLQEDPIAEPPEAEPVPADPEGLIQTVLKSF